MIVARRDQPLRRDLQPFCLTSYLNEGEGPLREVNIAKVVSKFPALCVTLVFVTVFHHRFLS
jgi:hypothetical protein